LCPFRAERPFAEKKAVGRDLKLTRPTCKYAEANVGKINEQNSSNGKGRRLQPTVFANLLPMKPNRCSNCDPLKKREEFMALRSDS
jgi:hypothetical protein